MATINGLLAFSPRLNEMGEVKDIFFTNLAIDGHEVTPSSPSSPLNKNIMLTDHITLAHDQANITLSLSSMLYSAVQENNYERNCTRGRWTSSPRWLMRYVRR